MKERIMFLMTLSSGEQYVFTSKDAMENWQRELYTYSKKIAHTEISYSDFWEGIKIQEVTVVC